MSKPETRVLVSRCAPTPLGRVCIGLVSRGRGVDGLAAARDCPGLCRRLREKGFLGETRHAAGDCTCGLQPAPRLEPWWGPLLERHWNIGEWALLAREALEQAGVLAGDPEGHRRGEPPRPRGPSEAEEQGHGARGL